MGVTSDINADRAPQNWIFGLFLIFGAAQLVAGIVYFFAFNWSALPDTAKIALPQIIMALGFIGWAAMGRASRLGAVAGILATMMIGVSMGVVGQVYQLGADPWQLFAIWAGLALPLAVIARNDAHFAVWFMIASIAYFLYTNENWRPQLPQAHSLIIAVYTVFAVSVLFVREFIAEGPPRWLRWVFASAALGAGLIGSFSDIFDRGFAFSNSFTASLTLLIIGAGLLAAYRFWRPDAPTQSLSLFAAAIFAATLGIRTILVIEIDSFSEIAFALLLSAIWVVGVTAMLAAALRYLKRPAAETTTAKDVEGEGA